MSKKRRNHSPEFKSKVALAALKGDQTTVELSQQYGINSNLVVKWKKQLIEQSNEVFALGKGLAPYRESEIQSLQAKIGLCATYSLDKFFWFRVRNGIVIASSASAINRIKDQSGMVSDKNCHSTSAQSPFASNIPGHHCANGSEFKKASSGLMPHSKDSG